MRAVMLAMITVSVMVSTWATGALASAPEAVEIHNGTLTLKATLFRPDTAGAFPTVVAMHGCEGLNNSSGVLSSRYKDWADRLNKAGFGVLLPDSYGSRNVGNQCRTRSAVRTDRERMSDAEAARKWLQTQSFAEADHISLLGWSGGGVSVLWTVRPRAKPDDDKPDFRSAVVFYPGCRRLDAAAWSARVPTLILIGGSDDVSSANACQQMVNGARGRSARVLIKVYPGAYHDFDHPRRVLQQRNGYVFSADGSGRIHSGTNPAARSDALRRATQWLGR